MRSADQLNRVEAQLATLWTSIDLLKADTEMDVELIVEKIKRLEESLEELQAAMEDIVRQYTRSASTYQGDIVETNIFTSRGKFGFYRLG